MGMQGRRVSSGVAATLDLVAPAYQWAPTYADTLGPEVADFCAAYGFVPDPEQRLILDAMFARKRDGRSIRDVGICAPRQNLKTGLLKMAALGWLFVLDLPLVVWSAHEFATTQEAFRDLTMLIEDNPDLDREVLWTGRGKTGIRRGSGDESIELRGNRRIIFRARTRDGGRGLTGHRVILDEAMKLKGETIAALVPTLRAVPDPQLVYAGSGGLLESEFWRSVRDRGRPGGDPGLAWFEWSDTRPWECEQPDCLHGLDAVGCALDDEARLRACNSALGRRITLDALREDRKTFAAFPVKYATETLGWWEDPPDGSGDDVLAGWADAVTTREPTGSLVLGIAVSYDSKHAALVVAGAGVLEVVDYRKSAGTGWIPARVAELRERHRIRAVGLLNQSAAAALAAPEPDGAYLIPDVTVLNTTEERVASLALVQGLGSTWQHRGQEPLAVAVRSAVRQLSGDGWRWSASRSLADISPLKAAVVAVHLAGEAPPDYRIEDSAW